MLVGRLAAVFIGVSAWAVALVGVGIIGGVVPLGGEASERSPEPTPVESQGTPAAVLDLADGTHILVTAEPSSEKNVAVLVGAEAEADVSEAVERQFKEGRAARHPNVRTVTTFNQLAAAVDESTVAIVFDRSAASEIDTSWLREQVVLKRILVGLNISMVELQAHVNSPDADSAWGEGDVGREPGTHLFFSALVIGRMCDNSLIGNYGPNARPDELLDTITNFTLCQAPVPTSAGGE